MKTIKLLIGLLCVSAVLAGCDKNEDTHDGDKVNQQVLAALLQKYPDSQNVEWRNKGNYIIADFKTSNISRAADAYNHSAWFDNVGTWYMTEIDITFERLPEAVAVAFRSGDYAAWRVDDVNKIDRSGVEVVYVIEVEQTTGGVKTEVDLYYSEDGVLVKTVVDSENDYEEYIPATPLGSISDYVKTTYPNARIIDVDYEDGLTKVEILDGNVKRDLLFDHSGRWMQTKTELAQRDVPASIITVLTASEYGSYRIDDIDHYLTTEGEYYRFELKSALGDVEIDITPAGTISVVSKDNTGTEANIGTTDAIRTFISTKYPNAKIVEIDYEDGLKEVEIFHDNREKSVYFNGREEWVRSEWDVRQSELPTAVLTAVKGSAYGSYKIDDIEFVQTPQGEFYLIELEQGNREVELTVSMDGKVM